MEQEKEDPASAQTSGPSWLSLLGMFIVLAIVIAICWAIWSTIFQMAKPVADTRSPDERRIAIISQVANVNQVKADGSDLSVQATIQSGDGASYVEDALFIAKDLGEALHKADAPGQSKLGEVVLEISGPVVDRLGHESIEPLFKMFYPASDLAAANFDNLSPGRQADLTRTVVAEGGAGGQAIKMFCGSEEMSAGSTAFCAP